MLTTIAAKIWMALTGLFLCSFLLVHLLGNLQLLLPLPQAQLQFNQYAEFLSGLVVIKVAAYGTYAAILGHSALAWVLTMRNRRAAGEAREHVRDPELAPWYSRWMGVLGTILLLFLVVHLKDFWYPFKFGGDLPSDSAGRRDLYGLVESTFQQTLSVIFYLVAMFALGFHLVHGVYSGLRTLGLSHPGYARWARRLGVVFAIVVSVGFAVMPVYIYLMRG